MRTLRMLLVVSVVLCCGIKSSTTRGDKESRDLEKELAIHDAWFEQENKKVVKAIKESNAKRAAFLLKADTMVLFKLDHRPVDEKKTSKPLFHGYQILQTVPITKRADRKNVATFLGKSFHWSKYRMAACFHPRHGLRVVQGKDTLELLICFECNRIDVYKNGKSDGGIIVWAKKQAIVKKLLKDGEKKPHQKEMKSQIQSRDRWRCRMPNGGSDCCGTCWFNARNKGEAGYEHANDPVPNFCTIRNLAIENAFWTYCGNHPHRRPDRDPIPLGPVFVATEDQGRAMWQPSPDTEAVRAHLLDLVRAIVEQPAEEYPAGTYTDELVVWQLGEFREARAASELQRITAFAPRLAAGSFGRTRASLIGAAKDALIKISKGLPAVE